MKLEGYEAIAYAEKYDIELSCAANPVDDGGFIDAAAARKIAQEDPTLITLTLRDGPDSEEYADILAAADELRRGASNTASN